MSEETPKQKLVKHRALLVDDEASILVTLSAILELRGLEAKTASSAKAAASLLNDSNFDLVITDMNMESETAGYKVIRAAHRHANRPATLIVSAFPLLTAIGKFRELMRCSQSPRIRQNCWLRLIGC